MKTLRQLIVGGALASAVVTAGCSEPTTLAREQPPTMRGEAGIAEAVPRTDVAMEKLFRESATRAAAVGDSQALRALNRIDSIKRGISVEQGLAAVRPGGTHGARKLGILEEAQANVPNAGWNASVIASSTTPTIDPFGNEFYITSFVQFFGTTGANQARYMLSGTASGSATLPEMSGNDGGVFRCLSSIAALAACSWIDSYTSVDRVAVSSTCGATIETSGAHRAWFSVPPITFGVSPSGPSMSTNNGPSVPVGGSGTSIDASARASNGRCITITMAETTAPATRVTATISGSCQNASWSSSDPTVAYLTTTAAGTAAIEARASGSAVISVTCSDGANGSKQLFVQRPEDGGAGGGSPPPSEGGDTGKCSMYNVYLINNNTGEVIMQLPDECLYLGFGTSASLGRTVREGMVSLDLSRSAIQPAGPPPTLPNGMPACTADKPNICWALLYNNPEFIDPENPWASPGRLVVGGGYTAYPLTVTYRYNGKVVKTGTATNPNTIPDPPLVKLTGVVDGDQVVYSATITDSKGVTLTTATNGWVIGGATYGEPLRRRELNRALREAIHKGDKSAVPKLYAVRKEIMQDMLARQPKHKDKH